AVSGLTSKSRAHYHPSAPSTLPDQLTSVEELGPTGTLLPNSDIKTFYSYDRDGRVTARYTRSDYSGRNTDVEFLYETTLFGHVPGTDSVFSTVSVNGGYYGYYFDFTNQRIRKEQPLGAANEYFWSRNHELLEDRENTAVTGGTPALDEYVWLGGRPV